MKRIAIIHARGGSKRLPSKNIKLFLGKPIIAYSIEAAIESKLFDEVMVSTDDDEIASIAKEYGALVPFMRSEKNSDDFASTADVILEVVEKYTELGKKFDLLCCIYSTAPTITSSRLQNAFELLVNGKYKSVFPVLKFNYPIQRGMVIKDSKIVMLNPQNSSGRTQDLELTYHDSGQFYWIWTSEFLNSNNIFTDNSGCLIVEEENSQDINTEFDWKVAEFKYKYNIEKSRNNKICEKIILGTAQFGFDYGINNTVGKLKQESVNEILNFAYTNSIGILDTAEKYGDSHEVIGKFHKAFDVKFKVITKFDPTREDLPMDLTERIKRNLAVLNVNYLYGYMFHSFDSFKKCFDQYREELLELKSKGLIQMIGVSVYTNSEINELLHYDCIDFVQFPFNFLDNINKRSESIEKLKRRGIQVHTRSTFLQGLFFKREIPDSLKYLEIYIDLAKQIATGRNIDLNTLALNYVFQQDNIDNVLFGVDSVEHLRKNINLLRTPISRETIVEINSIDVKETELLNPANWNR